MEHAQRDTNQAQANNHEPSYKELVETARQTLIIVQKRRFVWVNQATEALSGYSIKELIAMPARKVQKPHPTGIVVFSTIL